MVHIPLRAGFVILPQLFPGLPQRLLFTTLPVRVPGVAREHNNGNDKLGGQPTLRNVLPFAHDPVRACCPRMAAWGIHEHLIPDRPGQKPFAESGWEVGARDLLHPNINAGDNRHGLGVVGRMEHGGEGAGPAKGYALPQRLWFGGATPAHRIGV